VTERRNKVNPFFRKVKSVEDKNELLKQVRVEYEQAGAASFMICPTWEEYVEKISATIEVEQPAFVPPTPLTAGETVDFERRLSQDNTMMRVFGNRRTDASDLPTLLQKVADQQQAAELKDFLAPARRADNALNELIEKAVEKVIQKAVGPPDNRVTLPVRPLPERQGLMPLLTNSVDEDSTTDAAQFLRAFVSGDKDGMRAVVRSMVRAEAA
jgi:hypothetical protein